ncbi:branched-chain amino acid ABC transporter permease/ATP-binding protein [Jatrophihabitans sp.]|uniref:branched-chain amino acid ABC transporter permease/ATP-binding protein n=1 Tax=Jatrophihabitans sp. TaxID=1932789 RepID=UPI0030C75DF8|nr:hypothetical protein [Jatrophihabitans sp.]
MREVLQEILLGLGPGAMIALLGMGIVATFRGSGVLNFAHGAVAMLGAYSYYGLRFSEHWPTPLAMAGGVGIAAVVGALTQLLVMRPLRNAAVLTRSLATLGLMLSLQSAALLHWGSGTRTVPSSLPTNKFNLGGGLFIGDDRGWLLVISVVVTVALWFLYRRSSFGRHTTAAAENGRAAAALGVSESRLALGNWALGSALAGAAGILLVPIQTLTVTNLSATTIVALGAALVGGLASFPATLAGGLVIGVAQSVISGKVHLTGASDGVPLVVIVLALALRGQSLPMRNFVGLRLPRVGLGKAPLKVVLPLAAITIVSVNTWVPTNWQPPILNSLLLVLPALSYILLTGYAGQVSLGQLAFGGVGAFVAGELLGYHHWPFLAALGVGVLVTIPLGVVVGLPSLRTRGVALAVVTLSLASAINSMVFQAVNPIPISTLNIGGWDFDAILHVKRFIVVVVVSIVLVVLMMSNLRRNGIGRMLIALRSSERASAALGLNVGGLKLYAFLVSCAIAALGGILLAFSQNVVSADQFAPQVSIQLLAWTVIGGIGYLTGTVPAALSAGGGIAAYVLNEVFGNSALNWIALVGGVVLILTLIGNQDGVGRVNEDIAAAAVARGLPVPRLSPTSPILAARPVGNGSHARFDGPVLAVSGLTVRYGGNVALDGISFEIAPGQVVGLIGPNGAGKSTCVDAMTGFVRPSAGSVRFGTTDLSGKSARRVARAGVIRSFQGVELFDDLTVADNLYVASVGRSRPRFLMDLLWPRRVHLSPAASGAVERLGLTEALGTLPNELSYGQRRLVAIARAIAADPAVILLDEPAAGLDDTETAELRSVIQSAAQELGIGFLLIEHDVELVMSTCDWVIAINYGALVVQGPPEVVRRDPKVASAYLGIDPELEPAPTAGANVVSEADVDLAGQSRSGSL